MQHNYHKYIVMINFFTSCAICQEGCDCAVRLCVGTRWQRSLRYFTFIIYKIRWRVFLFVCKTGTVDARKRKGRKKNFVYLLV